MSFKAIKRNRISSARGRRKHEKEYLCRGSIVLNGVIFFIKAKNSEEAKEKARKGEFDYEIVGANLDDWDGDYESIEEN